MTPAHLIPPTQNPTPAIAAAIPRLRSARLVLRAPTLGDFAVLEEIYGSLAHGSMRDVDDSDASWTDFVQMTATWVWRGHGWWAVDDADGPCGFVGIGFEPGDAAPELGYMFTKATRGKGYATEACILARDFARDQLKLDALVSYVSDDNTASQNVARKLGASRDGDAEAAIGEDNVQVWRHLPALHQTETES